MMKTFLEEVTEHLLQHHGKDAGELCLVSPNRRAGLFFRKHFSKLVSEVMWAPETLSIEDFVNRISGLNVLDSTAVLFHFYEVYQITEGDRAKPFDDFIRWAPVLLNDMEEVDVHLDDPSSIYAALRDIKRIETWNPDGSPLTEFQKNYLAFFDRMEVWHQALNQHLLSKGLATQGLSSRQAATVVHEDAYTIPWKKVIFVGFNALTPSEEKIISTLLRNGKAAFFADGDRYYVDDTTHEAGHFLRKTLTQLHVSPADFPEQYRMQKKDIRIYGIARNVNQARLAGNILLQYPDILQNDQTAIVLANENLLIPLLNALPKEVEKVNVTMGYPLTKTNMYGFYDALWRLHLQRAKTAAIATAKLPVFYHRDLIRLLGHSCAGLLLDSDRGNMLTASILQKIRRANKSFFSFEELCQLCDEPGIFRDAYGFLEEDPLKDVASMPQLMLRLTINFDSLFREKASAQGSEIFNTNYFVDFEALYFISMLLRRLEGFLHTHRFITSYPTIYKLFKQLADTTRLSFAGEPLEGLQVMGMLETRNLDFRNVILLSANENILPRPRSNNSFIPFDLKKKFGLLVHSDKDAIYAYHFYRLLQRASNIFLVYNTQTEDLGSSEKSRFLTQLQMELPSRISDVRISEQIVSLPPPVVSDVSGLVIEKSAYVMDRLAHLCSTGISPSALNTYINCSLHFYLTYIAGIKEREELEETVEASTLGTVVHGVLDSLFRPLLNQPISQEAYALMLQQTERLCRQQFEEHYQGGDINAGKNLLMFNLAKRFVENFLTEEKRKTASDIQQQSLRILALEHRMATPLDLVSGGATVRVMIKGMADRIDTMGNKVRIIDYKTGRLKSNELKFNDWTLVGTDSRLGKVFQLLTYAWLYHKSEPLASELEPGIVSLRETKKGLQVLEHPDGGGTVVPAHLDQFEDVLRTTVSDIIDPAIAFAPTDDEEHCRYCSFRNLCRRY